MNRFFRVSLFTGMCILAAWIGNDLATAQPVPNHLECKNWICTGTHQSCILETVPSHFIRGCYSKVDAYCSWSGWTGHCPGVDSLGIPCSAQWPDCNNP
jgi:hypothetical protein